MKTERAPVILVIDNDEAIAANLTLKLKALGYHCIAVTDGREGLDVFNYQKVDLVITDLSMPVVDGLGVIQKIRVVSNVPIIVVTGYQKEFHKELQKHADVIVLSKPFRTAAIIDLIESDLSQSDAPSAA
jgi:CheY-like chemotaxis protein